MQTFEKKDPVKFDPNIHIGREIGNITLMSLLGQGAMGAVYIGYQKSLKRKVAVKIFPKESQNNSSMRLRFRDEAETVAVLNHPNIVPVFDMGESPEYLYIIMQYIEGEDLKSVLHRHMLHPVPSKRLLPPQFCLQLILQLLDALAYAHEENVIHRDIKPANIILENRSNRPYLVDFGIARTALSEDSQSNVILGTPVYISPEQVWHTDVDKRSDIYSTGIVLFELITGKLPLSKSALDDVLKTKMHEPENLFICIPSEASPQIDIDLERIILKSIAPIPDDRYPDCNTFRKDLLSYYERTFPDVKL